MKDNFQIQLEPSTLPAQEAEFRLFKALEMLINLDDIYDKKDNIQPVLSD